MRRPFDDAAWDLARKRRAGHVRAQQTREAKELLKQAIQIDAIARDLREDNNQLYEVFAAEAARRRNIAFLSNTVRRRAIARRIYGGDKND
jgi:hypothetical protein